MALTNPPTPESIDSEQISRMLTSQALERENTVRILPSQPQTAFIRFLKNTSRVATVSVISVLLLSALTLSWHFLHGVEAGLYQFRFGLSHFLLFTVVSSMVIVLSVWSSIYLRDLHRKHVEMALKESEERYRLVVEGSNEGIWDWDILNNHTYWNYRFFDILGIMPTDGMVTQGVFGERLHPDDRDMVLNALRNHLENRAPYEVELRLKTSSGDYRHCFSRGKAMFNAKGVPVRMAGMLIDLTPRKEMETQLKQARAQAENITRRKDKWIVAISQEMVMNLNHIIGYSEMLQNASTGELNEKQRRFSAHIHQGGQQLLNTVHGLANISRLEMGEIELAIETIALPAFMKDLESSLMEFALARKVTLQLDIQPDIDTLKADPDRLRQVLYNLLNNAIKFNRAGGIVNLRLRRAADPKWIVFEVEDTGMGIAPHRLSDIFKELYKKDTLSSPMVESGTTGLGLIYCRKLVELHGGTINVESTEDVGSIFTFRLPAQPE